MDTVAIRARGGYPASMTRICRALILMIIVVVTLSAAIYSVQVVVAAPLLAVIALVVAGILVAWAVRLHRNLGRSVT